MILFTKKQKNFVRKLHTKILYKKKMPLKSGSVEFIFVLLAKLSYTIIIIIILIVETL